MNSNYIEETRYIKKRQAAKNEQRQGERRKGHMNARLRFIRVVLVLMLIALGGRVAFIAIVKGDVGTRKVLDNVEKRTVARTLSPNRGAIVDRNRQNLAVSSIIYRMRLDVRMLNDADEQDKKRVNTSGSPARLTSDKVFEALSGITGITVTSLKEYISKNPDGTLKHDTHYLNLGVVSHAQMLEIRDHKDISFIFFEEETTRAYNYGRFAPQVIGFLRGGSVWGLERFYNTQLRGQDGVLYQSGHIGPGSPSSIEAAHGNTVVTTLDFTIQQIAQNAADRMYVEYPSQTTSVIVMNPQTGEILAMAQSPLFDLNAPADITQTTDTALKGAWAELDDEARLAGLNRLWRNFNVDSSFEPGSIFKPIVVAAALEEDIITTSVPASYFCNGAKSVVGWETPIPCHLAAGHGHQNLEQIIANSCNVAMMEIGELLGRSLFHKYQTEFGYGERTGIDLPAEASGLIHSLATLSPLDVAIGSFGQGFSCTPIQAMTSFAALLNGGNIMRPYVVSHITDKQGNIVFENRPKITRKVLSKQTSDYMRESMVSVVDSGTGRRAAIEGYAIGGKTGTGQQGQTRDEYTISFIAYLTAENPEILAITLIDRPEEYIEGSTSAAPVMRDLLMEIIEYRAIMPLDPELSPFSIRTAGTSEKLMDYAGMSVKDAIASLNMLGVRYQLMDTEGSVVTKQFPPAGSDVDTDSVVLLNIAKDGEEALIAVPDLTGLTLSQAVYVAENCGFVAVTDVPRADIITPNNQGGADGDAQADGGTDGDQDAQDADALQDTAANTPEPIVTSQLPRTGVSLPRQTQIIIETDLSEN